MSHHYAFVAARLVEQCLEQIQVVIDTDERYQRLHSSNASLYDMKEALTEIERQLFSYFVYIIQKEVENSSSLRACEAYYEGSSVCNDLADCATFLHTLLQEASLSAIQQPAHRTHSYYPRRSAVDSLLFRLNVALQLCLVRIGDARLVICGRRRDKQMTTISNTTVVIRATKQISKMSPVFHVMAGMLGAASLTLLYRRRDPGLRLMLQGFTFVRHYCLIRNAITSYIVVGTATWIGQKWSNLWMTNKIVKSTEVLEKWSQQWALVQCTPSPIPPNTLPPKELAQSTHGAEKCHDSLIDAARSQRLIEYALHETTKTSFWHSQGELRFLMLKRAMDVFYASVGTAMDLTGTSGNKSEENDAANWQLTLVTAAAASFYSVTGARDKAASVTSSSASARHLIQNAWGMVSLPAVKNLSLQASRLLKGAAVADRIEICGVRCFILSSDPAPELAAAIKRNRRLHQRRKPIATLSTIDERKEHAPCTNRIAKPFVQSSSRRHRQRDVVFHLTGGGFFAHIHSTDLPYLLDWSAATGAVVICPEYALLPEHTFPVALRQVEEIYHALVSNEAVSVLGFETNRIVVTGESAGGNLAASLCVMLSMDRRGTGPVPHHEIPPVEFGTLRENMSDETTPAMQSSFELDTSSLPMRLPDALMLSCPVLDLSLEMSHSRVVGTEDPVLPSGLLSAISDAYLPKRLGVSKKDPLASPFYASDAVLRHFPPTLLFASSNDPLLDDSVVFNQRLREQGVDSDLVAAHNLPHAYLGLGTAGFPEALQVQEQCVNWLTFQLTREGAERNEVVGDK